jgi:putative transposase
VSGSSWRELRGEPTAIEYAARFPAWGHRKLAMLLRVDGSHAPDATVLRALRNGLAAFVVG